MTRPAAAKIVSAILLAGLFVRLAVLFLGTPVRQVGALDDDGDYFRFARVMVQHGVIASEDPSSPTVVRAWRGPLFFTFQYLVFRLHGVDNFLAVRLYLTFLSLLVPLALFVFCSRLWDDRTGVLACLWATFHPPFVHYAAHVQSDSLTLMFSTWGLVLLMAQKNIREAAFAGLLMGIATLGRSQFCLAVGLGFLWMLVRPQMPQRWTRAAVFMLCWALPLVPWWVRNYRVFDRVVPFTTEGGFTLWVGLNDWTDGGGNTRPSDVPQELSEVEKDKWHYRQAFAYLKSHPQRSFELAVSKISRFWGLVPRVGSWKVKLVSFIAYAPLFVCFFAGFWVWRKKFWEWAPILGICAYYTALHSLFPAVMRYRLPIEPFMIALAAPTLLLWLERKKSA